MTRKEKLIEIIYENKVTIKQMTMLIVKGGYLRLLEDKIYKIIRRDGADIYKLAFQSNDYGEYHNTELRDAVFLFLQKHPVISLKLLTDHLNLTDDLLRRKITDLFFTKENY